MTKGDIINKIKSILEELSYKNAVFYLTLNDIVWLKETVKALEQETVSRESYEHEYSLRKEYEIKTAKAESILNKVRDELCDLIDSDAYSGIQQAFNDGLWKAVKIIDKCKSESEK